MHTIYNMITRKKCFDGTQVECVGYCSMNGLLLGNGYIRVKGADLTAAQWEALDKLRAAGLYPTQLNNNLADKGE